MNLRPRDLAVLRVLAESGRETSMGLPPGRVWQLACPDEPYRQRRDAGMTRTLDRLQNLRLVRGRYEWGGTGRYWTITVPGRRELERNGPTSGPTESQNPSVHGETGC